MKKITELLNLLVSIVKARWIFLSAFTAVISALIWLRDKLFLVIEIKIPVIAIISIFILALYPIAKLIEWIFFRNQIPLVEFRGLLWKPSRFRFRYPSPVCPKCECKIIYRIERKSMILAQSISDFNNAQDKMIKHVYECPNHGVLSVQNVPVDYLQELVRTKINSERKK